ncbi:HNH endonuclease [Frankia sp. AgKG'84/4]|uniref:HNH endonuclease n=1 Tax=Frankia sp. AgKG'84/4 TaxID=573490 RepID=UPI00202AA038|nr:HNH endonuclease signature motif containing protein [Frankia sp. AgKG'84/4]MCL9794416.1 HNH endonuclease [Frankia sp. AgKG'84/4]
MFDENLDGVPLPDLEEKVCGWAGRLSATTCRWLGLLAAFDRRGGWTVSGLTSCAHWLSWRCGIGLRACYEYVRVARALTALPHITGAFSHGEISYSKVRVLTTVATPDTDAAWLHEARHHCARTLTRRARLHRHLHHDQTTTHPDSTDSTRDDPVPVRCTSRWNDDGTFSLTLRLDPLRGATVARALELAETTLTQTATPPGITPPGITPPGITPPGIEDTGPARETTPGDERPAAEKKADAFAAIATSFLTHGAPRLADPTPYSLTVLIDLDTLLGKTARILNAGTTSLARSVCELAGGPILPPGVARRLACDSAIRTLINDPNGNPLALGRNRRNPTSKVRKAVYARDRGTCQYPGCHHTRWLHIHHIKEWEADHGKTEPKNLTLLCSHHHKHLHDNHLTVTRNTRGQLTVHHPDSATHHPAPTTNTRTNPDDRQANHHNT